MTRALTARPAMGGPQGDNLPTLPHSLDSTLPRP